MGNWQENILQWWTGNIFGGLKFRACSSKVACIWKKSHILKYFYLLGGTYKYDNPFESEVIENKENAIQLCSAFHFGRFLYQVSTSPVDTRIYKFSQCLYKVSQILTWKKFNFYYRLMKLQVSTNLTSQKWHGLHKSIF